MSAADGREGLFFYDKVAALLDRYNPEDRAQLRSRLAAPDPEDRFTKLVREQLRPDDAVLDLGTGSGIWLRNEVCGNAGTVVGIDPSRDYLRADRTHTAFHTGCEFMQGMAESLPFQDGTFDVILSRRGPLTASEETFEEACRVLKTDGRMVEITIGEQNAKELDALFGERSQMHVAFHKGPVVPDMLALYRTHDLEPLAVESLVQQEYFPSRKALEYRLMTTPIVQDFDPVQDSGSVDKLIEGQMTPRGIEITLHRVLHIGERRGGRGPFRGA